MAASMTHCTHRGSLMENNIEMIPVDFFSGTNIQYLGLSMNQIGTFPSDSLRRMTSLIFLSLDDNKLTSVSRRNLASLSESPLQHLNLSNNEISYLAPRGFSKLTHLKILELHQNSISAIQPGVFDGISNILHMYLQDNVIQEIEGKIFGGSCDMDEMYDVAAPDPAPARKGCNGVYERNAALGWAVATGTYVGFEEDAQIKKLPLPNFLFNRHGDDAPQLIPYARQGLGKGIKSVRWVNQLTNRTKIYRFACHVVLTHHRVDHGGPRGVTMPTRRHTILTGCCRRSALTSCRVLLPTLGCLSTTTTRRRGRRWRLLPHHLLHDLTPRLRHSESPEPAFHIQNNKIASLPDNSFEDVSAERVNLANNNIETIGTDSSIRHLNVTSFDISGNPLVCTCGVFYTMYEIQSAIVGGECEGPSSLVGTHFVRKKSGSPLYFLNRDEKLFQCTPLDFEASAPAYQTILAKWSSPDTPYPIFDDNLALNTYVNWTYTYTVTCNSDKGFVATGNTTELFLLLGPDDGVKEDTLYTCSATLTFNGNTSVAGNSASVLTLAEPNSVNGSVDRESNITLPITYYDFRFWEASFFPLDDVGYGSQSQRDCVFQLHNLGTAIRFNGNEELAVGGGEEIWVFLNKVLVVELHRGYQFSTNCKKITLRQDHIGTYFAIREGDVIAGECHVNSDQSDVQYLDLVIGEKYRLDIFHTERQSCASDFLLELRGFSLLGDDDRVDVYNVVISEDLSVNSSLATITVGDVFSTSTLSVSIISGNEARHFTFENSTGPNVGAGNFTGIAQDGPTYEVNEIVFSTCPTDPVLNQEPNVTGIQEFIITSVFADLVLDVAVDHEVATEYFLVIFVEDDSQVPTRTGSIKIQILVEDSNDNCPILHGNDSHSFFPLPVLSREPLAVVRATDADVGVNSQLTFTTATLSSMPMDNSSFYMVEIIVAAIDGGTPSLGDVVLVNLTISETCVFDILGESIESSIYINETTGELHLRVPKYYLFEYDCRDPRGMENGIIRDGMITASSVLRDDYSPDKARLYSAATERGPIGSGWVPAVSDTKQWIQVDMGEVTIFSGLQTQGSLDNDHWVETYQVAYSNDTSSWTYVQESRNIKNFTANSNKNGVKLNMFEEVYARYIRIYPKTWNIEIGLRFEILGCTTERRFRHLSHCERCETTNYCIGDGLQRPCGRCDPPQVDCPRSPTEHSFGHASECSECPIGWLCVDGYATHCPTYTYVTCNTTYCPNECTTCEAGTACFDGQRFPCGPGTFSRGYDTESCKPCAPGSYNNESLQSECTCCDSGFSSTEGKTECTPCQPSEFSLGDCSVCQPCLSEADCPCLSLPGPCTEGVTCVNTGGTGGYRCLDCPKGFTGTGDNCRDINECSEANPCYVNTSCVNLEPGFECGSCPPGYNGKVPHGIGLEYAWSHVQVCTDINECAIDNGGCDVHAICENTIGSFTCTTVCEAGYIIGDDGRGCTPGDYCFLDLDDCHGNASCTTTGEGTFQCECDGGFAGNGVVCELDDDADGRPAATLACDLDNFDGCQGDNCPTFPNSGQEDVDGDGFGDACDEDDDSDRIKDAK
ncbi:uncharacterized protein, partial [Diadema antillarum]|uniref:uncharacterized protein n=1 Tax=Diadema antillarum TaxID=105358 RepID=UPI003A862C8A